MLTEAPLPCIKKDSEDLNSDAVSEESDDQDMHEMLLQLKKSGIRTINNSKNFSSVKTKKVLSDQKVLKKSSESDNNTPVKKRNIKKKLIDEFENLNNINVTQKRSTRSKSVVQVPELDKLPEDLILHYKRTSKQVKRLELANTPEIVKRLSYLFDIKLFVRY